ncbi:DUF4839 domain-containing protein [Salinibacterium sp. SWN1162]|uniref:DUF4839 domain-containing protein n=1 Tax=Salinibacterium sp. SWN1162 TaxID=2792053 RepID=UPI0018CDD316|nr:DUF4839 domain-containing protein [Salinibacterium sp. SWN1162]MBH0010115.1 DUF4839 domain-containing protein [Salinibacterium sp. SWN1162]
MSDGIEYTIEKVRVLRINESKTIAQRKADGWEFVSQQPLTLRTEITFRRPKRKLPKGWVIGVSAGAAVLTIAAISFGIASEQNEPTTPVAEISQPTRSEPSQIPSETPSRPPITPTAEAVESTTTSDINASLTALLELEDYCDPSIGRFVEKYEGDTISFPANIAAIAPHDGATTRYDILIGSGEYSESSARGPAFQFRDVNTTDDLKYVGAVPDVIDVGMNLNVTARVDAYEPNSCLLLLSPVAIAMR